MKILLNRSPIYGFAFERQEIRDTSKSYKDKIAEHIIKCVVYSVSYTDYSHWIDELVNWLIDIDRMKPKKFKIKSKDYRETAFSKIGTSVSDAESALNKFRENFTLVDKNPFPDFVITYNLCDRLCSAYNEFADVISEKLGKYNSENQQARARDVMTKDIRNILDKYCNTEPIIVTK